MQKYRVHGIDTIDCNDANFPQMHLQIWCNPKHILLSEFILYWVEIDKLVPKFIWKCKRKGQENEWR